VADCSASLRLEPNVANTHENRGFAYLRLGDFDRALATTRLRSVSIRAARTTTMAGALHG
jgi:hypothetical protein